MSSFIEDPIWQLWGKCLLHFIWQGCVLGALWFVGMAFLKKRSAQSRYLVSCVFLFVMGAAPLVTGFLLGKAPVVIHYHAPVATVFPRDTEPSPHVEAGIAEKTTSMHVTNPASTSPV